jgi:cytochrome b561
MATTQGYNPLSLLLHWFTVVWFCIMWTAGVLISQWSDAPDFVYDLHVTVGVCGAAIILFRIVHRVGRGFAPANPDHAAWERVLARGVQWVFLIALSLAITTGLLKAFMGAGSQYFLWGAELPSLGRLGRASAVVEPLHLICSFTLFLAVILHLAGALKHAVLSRDGTLMRILKPTKPGR